MWLCTRAAVQVQIATNKHLLYLLCIHITQLWNKWCQYLIVGVMWYTTLSSIRYYLRMSQAELHRTWYLYTACDSHYSLSNICTDIFIGNLQVEQLPHNSSLIIKLAAWGLAVKCTYWNCKVWLYVKFYSLILKSAIKNHFLAIYLLVSSGVLG